MHRLALTSLVALAVALPGCHHCGPRPCPQPCPNPRPGPGPIIVPPPGPGPGPGVIIPKGQLPDPPVGMMTPGHHPQGPVARPARAAGAAGPRAFPEQE